MRFDPTHLRLSSIDIEDDRYRITTAPSDNFLERSISAVGLLHPPVLQAVLQKTAGSHIVVSGFNRIKAVSALGWRNIYCLVLPGDTAPEDCLLFSIADNISSRSLNILEQANAVHKLSAFVPDKPCLCAMLEDIGLSLSPGLISKYERLLAMPDEVRIIVGRGLMTLGAALSLENMDFRSVHMICKLIVRLCPGTNQQKEILARLKEIAAQKNIPVSSVLEFPDISGILNSGETDRKAMLRRLRKALRRLCFPSLCTMEEQFAESLSRLGLPPGMRFIFPEGFEDTRYRLELEVKSASDMENYGRLMQEISSHSALLEIFKRELRD